jgi:hypothetical protein
MYLREAELTIVLSPFLFILSTDGALIHSTWRRVFIKPSVLCTFVSFGNTKHKTDMRI